MSEGELKMAKCCSFFLSHKYSYSNRVEVGNITINNIAGTTSRRGPWPSRKRDFWDMHCYFFLFKDVELSVPCSHEIKCSVAH